VPILYPGWILSPAKYVKYNALSSVNSVYHHHHHHHHHVSLITSSAVTEKPYDAPCAWKFWCHSRSLKVIGVECGVCKRSIVTMSRSCTVSEICSQNNHVSDHPVCTTVCEFGAAYKYSDVLTYLLTYLLTYVLTDQWEGTSKCVSNHFLAIALPLNGDVGKAKILRPRPQSSRQRPKPRPAPSRPRPRS